MNRLDKILSRIYEHKGFSKDIEFCKTYKIKQNTLSTWKKRDSIPYELIENISQDENVSLDWLLNGKGNKNLDSSTNFKNKNKQVVGKNGNATNINGSNSGIIANKIININPNNYSDEDDIKEIVELLEIAPKQYLERIKEELKKMQKLVLGS